MLSFSDIKILIEQRNYTVHSFAPLLDMTGAGLTSALNKDTLKVRDLKKIAKLLDMDICDFFREEERTKSQTTTIQNNANGLGNILNINQLNDPEKEIKYLKEMLIEKERLIQFLMNK